MSPVAQFWRNARTSKWFIPSAIVGVLFVLALAAGIILAFKWPFYERDLKESIQEIVPGTVRIEKFRSTVLPYPGCVAEGVSVQASSGDPMDRTSVNVQSIAVRARYWDLILRPGYIARIVLRGLQVHVPTAVSKSSTGTGDKQTQSSSKTRVGEIVADGAVLQIARKKGKKPLNFEMHSLRLTSVSRASAMSYSVSLTNPLPPGEIVSKGQIGPFPAHDIGKTPVSGSYQLWNADLSMLPGVAGALSSKGAFGAELDQIQVHGAVNVDKFEVKSTGHPVQLQADYVAAVDALHGNVALQQLQTRFLRTSVVASGQVANQPGGTGKVASLNVAVQKGRIQDVLGLFVTQDKPPVSGETSFRAVIQMPSSGSSFLKSVRLDGDFDIEDGRFTNSERQANIDTLSTRASGGKTDANSDPGLALSKLTGKVQLRGGVATFSNTVFTVPGASARLNGTYDLISEKVDVHGLLRTQAELSQTTGGIKSVILRPLDRFFKRKHAGAQVPVSITGNYSNPHFGVDLNPAHASAQLKP